MKTLVAFGLMLLGPVWFALAWSNLSRGDQGIALVQTLAGIAFFARGIVEWRKRRANE